MKLQVMVLLLEPYTGLVQYDTMIMLCFTLEVSMPFKAEIVLRHKYKEFKDTQPSVQKAAVQRREQAIG